MDHITTNTKIIVNLSINFIVAGLQTPPAVGDILQLILRLKAFGIDFIVVFL